MSLSAQRNPEFPTRARTSFHFPPTTTSYLLPLPQLVPPPSRDPTSHHLPPCPPTEIPPPSWTHTLFTDLHTPHGTCSFQQLGLPSMAFILEVISTTDISLRFFKNKHLTSILQARVSKNLTHSLRISGGSLEVAQCGLLGHLSSHRDHQSCCAKWMASSCAGEVLLPSRRDGTVIQKHLEHSGPRSQPGQHKAAERNTIS